MTYNCKPFVKWAGGKTQLLDKINEMKPDNYKNYLEPFLGGGAVLFDIIPEKAIVNDINKELITVYKQIKNNALDFITEIEKIDEKITDKNSYMEIRSRYNEKIINKEYDVEMAALFVSINKHCFNGLYRVNKKGLFNVPYNNKTNGASIVKDNIIEISKFLNENEINIYNEDFEETLKRAKPGDFIFIDSPYAPINEDTFDTYTAGGFSREDHIRLAECFKKLTVKGCYCMLTNHNTDFINSLYKDYNIKVVDVKRFINRDAKNRKGQEVIITNY